MTKTRKVTGIVTVPNHNPYSIRPTVYGYVTFQTLRSLGIAGDYNRLYVVVAGNRTSRQQIETIITEVNKRTASSGTTVLGAFIPEPGTPALQDSLQTILLILSVSCFISPLL